MFTRNFFNAASGYLLIEFDIQSLDTPQRAG